MAFFFFDSIQQWERWYENGTIFETRTSRHGTEWFVLDKDGNPVVLTKENFSSAGLRFSFFSDILFIPDFVYCLRATVWDEEGRIAVGGGSQKITVADPRLIARLFFAERSAGNKQITVDDIVCSSVMTGDVNFWSMETGLRVDSFVRHAVIRIP